MAVVKEQSQYAKDLGDQTESVNGIADTFATTPTSGNLLITVCVSDKSSGGMTIPSGWTEIGTQVDNASTSLAMAYKISAGTEGLVTWSQVTSRAEVLMWLAEFSGFGGDPLDVIGEANSGVTAVTSQTTGTTGTLVRAESYAVACWSIDTFDNLASNRAYTNTFVEELAKEPAIPDPFWGNTGIVIALKQLSATSAVESTFSGESGSDQCAGKVAVFMEQVPFTLASDAGAYTETGGAAVGEIDRVMVAEAGAYAESGSAATVTFGRTIVAETGTFTLTGGAAVGEIDYVMAGVAGTYIVTGGDAVLTSSAVAGIRLIIID